MYWFRNRNKQESKSREHRKLKIGKDGLGEMFLRNVLSRKGITRKNEIRKNILLVDIFEEIIELESITQEN